MIQSLQLTNFKNFRDATLSLARGRLTLLVGTNASGKSNLRDAFRFLQGIVLGHSLADIIGGKYIGGLPAWNGIRGGTKEIAYSGTQSFSLKCRLGLRSEYFVHHIGGDVSRTDMGPQLHNESLHWNKSLIYAFDSSRQVAN